MLGNHEGRNQGHALNHELWLAMQAAHDRYKNTAATLDALTAISPAGNSSPESRLAIDAAAAEQRAAFENYIEARLELSECVISQFGGPPLEQDRKPRFWYHSRISQALLLGTVAALLLPAAFRVGYLQGQGKQVRDIESAHDGAEAMLMLMSSQVEPPSARDASKSAPQETGAGQPELATAKAGPPRPSRPTQQRPARSVAKVARNHPAGRQPQKRAERDYHAFLFTSWKQTERIGRVRLTVLKSVPEKGFSDLSIAVDNLRPTRKRVTLNEPVWIELNGRPKALELVVNRIDGSRVGGYLSEPKYQRLSWWRVSPEFAMTAMP